MNKVLIRSTPTVTLLLLTVFACTAVRADSWFLPKKRKYYSAGKKYRLEVIPKKLESQLEYFDDKSKGREDAGGVKGLKENRARAIFYAREGTGYKKKWEFPLVNEVSPVSALLSKDGQYVVTFDNWHSAGYGDDVVVIYKSDGTLVKKFSLEDLFTRRDIKSFEHTVSSIWWGDNHYIDDKQGILHLKAQRGSEFRDRSIHLKTGELLGPKKHLFADTQLLFKVAVEPSDAPANASLGITSCAAASKVNFESADVMRVGTEQLYSKLKEAAPPVYPPIAKAARAEGRVVVELLVSTTGDVICIRTLAGHPLFIAPTMQAVRQWKFEPFDKTEGVSAVVGTLAVNFGL